MSINKNKSWDDLVAAGKVPDLTLPETAFAADCPDSRIRRMMKLDNALSGDDEMPESAGRGADTLFGPHAVSRVAVASRLADLGMPLQAALDAAHVFSTIGTGGRGWEGAQNPPKIPRFPGMAFATGATWMIAARSGRAMVANILKYDRRPHYAAFPTLDAAIRGFREWEAQSNAPLDDHEALALLDLTGFHVMLEERMRVAYETRRPRNTRFMDKG